MIPTSSYNLFTKGKWLLLVPYKKINTDLTVDNFSLNLKSFNAAGASHGDTNFMFQGTPIPVVFSNRDQSRIITFRYNMSSDWQQYRFLYEWFNMVGDEEGKPTSSIQEHSLDLTLYVLSEFKQPRFAITFYSSVITSIGNLELDYMDGERIVVNSFTVKYSHFAFDEEFSLDNYVQSTIS